MLRRLEVHTDQLRELWGMNLDEMLDRIGEAIPKLEDFVIHSARRMTMVCTPVHIANCQVSSAPGVCCRREHLAKVLGDELARYRTRKSSANFTEVLPRDRPHGVHSSVQGKPQHEFLLRATILFSSVQSEGAVSTGGLRTAGAGRFPREHRPRQAGAPAQDRRLRTPDQCDVLRLGFRTQRLRC